MTYWVVYFEDSPAMLEVRKSGVEKHIDYLKQNADKIVVAGGLKLVPESPFVGGLWIVQANDYDEVLQLVLNDPYFRPELRQFKIHAWGKAIDKPVTL